MVGSGTMSDMPANSDTTRLARAIVALFVLSALSQAQHHRVREVVLEDFADLLTNADAGFNGLKRSR